MAFYDVCMDLILPILSRGYVKKFNQPLRGPSHYYCYYYYNTLDVWYHALCVCYCYYYEFVYYCDYYTTSVTTTIEF